MLYRIGCLGRISSFSETNDGRYLITLTGIVRFEVAEELSMHRGYRRVRAELSRFSADLDASSELRLDREALLAALRRYFAQRGIDANWDALSEMPDYALIVTLSMVCPFDPTEKQALLEAPTPAERAEVLLSLLLIDSHAVPADTSPHFRAS